MRVRSSERSAGRTGGERADDEERVFEHRGRLCGHRDELDHNRHDAVGKRLDAPPQLADDALPNRDQ